MVWGCLRQEILEEIFFKEWLGARNQSSDLRRNLYGNKIFKQKSLTKIRNSTLLCRRDLMGIALQARHLNENLTDNL